MCYKINTTQVEEIIQNDRRVTLREILSTLGLTYGSMQRVVSDALQYSKVCVPAGFHVRYPMSTKPHE